MTEQGRRMQESDVRQCVGRAQSVLTDVLLDRMFRDSATPGCSQALLTFLKYLLLPGIIIAIFSDFLSLITTDSP